jgi:hypothetical protein
MQTNRHSWPDIDGAQVALGDWVEVFCSWSRQPKFEGRPVQVVDVLQGGIGSVFRVRDPESLITELYVIADARGYRRVGAPEALN